MDKIIKNILEEPILKRKVIGEQLNKKEQNEFLKIIETLYKAVDSRRNVLLSHNSLQNIIMLFFESFGFNVDYEKSFYPDKFNKEPVRFDVIARKGKQHFIIEVKDTVSFRDLGQIHGYANTMQFNKFKAKVFLGTDILNYNELITGPLGEMIRELMEREEIGIILVDKHFMITFFSLSQFDLVECPQIWFSESPMV